MTNITEFVQRPNLDQYISLYQIDASIYGGGIYYFTPMVKEGINVPVVFNGNTYVPVDFESEGWENNGQGQLPQPKIRIGNTDSYVTALLQQYDDMLGAVVTRIRTFKRYLDGEVDANPLMTFPQDIYRIDRKSTENKFFIEFELAAPIEQANRQLPGRQVLRDVCTHRYRIWNPLTLVFDYTFVSCPYVGANKFDTLGQVVSDPAQDKCGKRPTDCTKRFPTLELPFRGFPGVSRVRLN